MKLEFIDINQLKPSPINVRKHGDKSGDDLIASIKANGVIQPLLVRKNCSGFEVVAGQRRYNAACQIAEEAKAGEDVAADIASIPCAIMEAGDDVKAIEASLAENIDRLPMEELDQYEAFLNLSRCGQSVDDIANHFGVTTRLVQQRLAIATLYPPILNAYRREEVSAQEIRHLTMASTKQQKDWFKLFKDDDAPPAWRLKQWLFGGEEIPTSNALFDLETYDGVITSDLFGDECYFADPASFWEHQSRAIAEIKLELEEDGWQDVVLLDVGERWHRWEHAKVTQQDGGKIYIDVRADGEVAVHEGFLPEKAAKQLEKAKLGEAVSEAEKPELTKPMQNYLDLHRHAAVRCELLSHQGVALRLAVAQIIAGSCLWDVKADPQTASNDKIAESLRDNKAEAVFADKRQDVRELLGLVELDDDTLVYRKNDWDKSHDLQTVFTRLLLLTDEEAMTILTFVVAETLPAGSETVERLGGLLSVDMSDHWSPDDAFFDLQRDKEAINTMVKHIAGKRVADSNLTATAKVQKQIIQDCLNGTNGRKAKPDWQPHYMRFPMQGYTKRQKTINAVAIGDAFKKDAA